MSCNQPKAILPSNSGATSRPSEPESSIPTTFVVVGQFPSKPTEARSKSLSGTPPKFVVQQVSGKNNRNVARAMSVLPCIITRGMSSVEGSFDSSVTNLKTFRSLDTISACVPAKGMGRYGEKGAFALHWAPETAIGSQGGTDLTKSQAWIFPNIDLGISTDGSKAIKLRAAGSFGAEHTWTPTYDLQVINACPEAPILTWHKPNSVTPPNDPPDELTIVNTTEGNEYDFGPFMPEAKYSYRSDCANEERDMGPGEEFRIVMSDDVWNALLKNF